MVNMKRKIYILISMIIMISTFVVPFYFLGLTGIPMTIILYLIYGIISLGVTLILDIDNNNNAPTHFHAYIIPPFIFLTFGFKKIYYSDLGYFWIRKVNHEIYIYKQSILYMTNIGCIRYVDDIEKLKLAIKDELEYIYEQELYEKRKKDKEKEIWKSWDGCVDKKSERDNKLNEILK